MRPYNWVGGVKNDRNRPRVVNERPLTTSEK